MPKRSSVKNLCASEDCRFTPCSATLTPCSAAVQKVCDVTAKIRMHKIAYKKRMKKYAAECIRGVKYTEISDKIGLDAPASGKGSGRTMDIST